MRKVALLLAAFLSACATTQVPVTPTVVTDSGISLPVDALVTKLDVVPVSPNEANIHVLGGVAAGAAPPTNICAPFAIDNGCTNRAAMISTGRQPGYQDTNMLIDSAASSQIANPNTNPTQYAIDAASRTAFFRKFNEAIMGLDYPNGAQDPTDSGTANVGALKPISSLTTDPNRGDCNYCPLAGGGPTPCPVSNPYGVVSGATPSQPNYVYCLPAANNEQVILANYDWSNTGSGNDTDFVPLFIKNSATNWSGTSIEMDNNYNSCSSQWCQQVSGSAGTGFHNWWIGGQTCTLGGGTYISFTINNLTLDGKFFQTFETTGFDPILGIMNDGRCNATATQMPLTANYVVEKNAGHDPFNGSPPTIMNISFLDAIRVCMSGFSGCHGEVAENAQLLGLRPHATMNYTGIVWLGGGFGPAGVVPEGEMTAPIYMGSGNANGVIVDAGSVKNSLFLNNNGYCVNSPTPGDFPYGPTNPCTQSGSPGNSGFINTDWAPDITTLTLTQNLEDVSGQSQCYANEYNQVGTMTAHVAAGNVFTFDAPAASNPAPATTLKFVSNWYTGQGIHDTVGADGFTDTYLLPPTAQPAGSMDNFAHFTAVSTVSGTMTTSVSQNLEIGQAIFQNGNTVGSTLAFIGGGTVGTAVSGTSFTVVTASGGSTPAGTFTSQEVRSYNDIPGSGIGGQEVAVGPATMGATEPAVAQRTGQAWRNFAYIASLTASDNWVGGTSGTGAGTLMSMASLQTPANNNNCL